MFLRLRYILDKRGGSEVDGPASSPFTRTYAKPAATGTSETRVYS